MDFEKAFDTPPHELLKSKLFIYGIGGNTLKRIASFLCFRQQRVVVNGVKSDRAPVLSGVLQVTVVGPLLFSLYIIDMSSDIESEIRLFADDCVCYREIKNKEDTMKLQRDITRLSLKCHRVLISTTPNFGDKVICWYTGFTFKTFI